MLLSLKSQKIRDMKITKERKQLEKDLIFYLRHLKKMPAESREKFEIEIQRIVEKLKEL